MRELLIGILLLVIIGLSGCSSISLKPNNEYISNFKKQTNGLNSKKKVGYVISNIGPAFIECNNKRYRVEKNEYIRCTMNDSINTISIGIIAPGLFGSSILETENTYPTTYMSADNLKSQNTFFLYDFNTHRVPSFRKINKQSGMSIVGNPDFKVAKKSTEPTRGIGYDISLFNPSLFYYMTEEGLESNIIYKKMQKDINRTLEILKKEQTSSEKSNVGYSKSQKHTNIKRKATNIVIDRMTETELLKLYLSKTLMKLDDSSEQINTNAATVIIYREADNGNAIVGLWSKDNYLGSLITESYIQFKTNKSELELYTKYGQLKKIKIFPKKGKVTYIEADSEIGWNHVYTSLKLKEKKDFKDNKIMHKVVINQSNINKNYQERIQIALKSIKNQ